MQFKRKSIFLLFGLGLVAAAMPGCSTPPGSTSPSATTPNSAAVAQNIYNQVCVGSAGNPPITAAIDTLVQSGSLTMNSKQAAFYATLKTDCSFGPPTTFYSATLWTLTFVAAIEAQFPQFKIKV
jgi:hypothetical protein